MGLETFALFRKKLYTKLFGMDWFNCFKILHQQPYRFQTELSDHLEFYFSWGAEAHIMILFKMSIKNIKNIKLKTFDTFFSLSLSLSLENIFLLLFIFYLNKNSPEEIVFRIWETLFSTKLSFSYQNSGILSLWLQTALFERFQLKIFKVEIKELILRNCLQFENLLTKPYTWHILYYLYSNWNIKEKGGRGGRNRGTTKCFTKSFIASVFLVW